MEVENIKTRFFEKHNIFYGWIIVIASLILTAASIGVFTSTNSVFVKPITDSLGFSRGEFTFYLTINTLTSATLMPIYGKMIEKYGIKKIMLICAIFVPMVPLGYSISSHLWQFYLFGFIHGIFSNGLTFMIVGALINNWFEKKKAFATGLAFCGSGIGGSVMVQIAGWLVEKVGWRQTYVYLAIIGISVLLPVIIFLIKDSPQTIGLEPYGKKKNEKINKGEVKVIISGIGFKQALKTPTFWFLITGFIAISICASATATHTLPYLTDIGYSTYYASGVMSTIMIFLTIGKLLLGQVFDRLGTLSGSIFVGLFCIAAPLFALIATNPIAPWIYAFCIGMASAGFSVPVAVLINKYFGAKDFTTIFSVCSMSTTFGGAIGVPLLGIIYDLNGNYQLAWYLLLVCGIIIITSLTLANITSKKLKWEQ